MSVSWAELVTAALIGTDRQRASSGGGGDPAAAGGGAAGGGGAGVPGEVGGATLTGLADGVRAAGTDGGLLDAAAVIAVARRAGGGSIAGVARPEPAPAEPRPLVGDAAAARLRGLLSGSDPAMLALWLTLAAERDLRVPAQQLPRLFELAGPRGRFESLRPLVVTVAGTRGAWLATQRSDWGWVIDSQAPEEIADPETWHLGSGAERIAYLAGLRRRDPAAAAALLAEAWPTEAPDNRATLLGTLAEGLSTSDEEFIEKALDDRRKEVRLAAAELLARLDGSAYRQRMVARAHAAVTRNRNRLAVTPPAACDPAMKRDGIDPKPPQGTGERAWWLEQVVMRTPLVSWEHLGTPAELATVNANDNWAPTLRRAWARAAVAAHDPVWAVVLVESGFGRGKDAEPNDALLAVALCELLPPAAAEAQVLRMLKEPQPHTVDVVRLLPACPRPYSPVLTTALLAFLRGQIVDAKTTYFGWLTDLRDAIAEGLAYDTIHQVNKVAAAIPEDRGGADLFQALIKTVSDRHQTYQEFA